MNKGLKRLTKKTKNGYLHKLFGNNPIYTREQMISDLDSIVQKLGQLEDIEDELGIDLVTLYRALKNGIYIKKQSETKYPLALLRTHYSNHTTRYYVFDNGKEKEIKLNKYGKIWALTKGELL